MNRTVTRIKGRRFCRLELRLEDGRLSICGTEGRILSRKMALADARRYWESFFEDSPEEIFAMNKNCGTKFSSPKSAARYVLNTDGEFHGLDVIYNVEGAKDDQVFLSESCGQIVETLAEWFPEVKPYLKWHLNDMHAECTHQEVRGETFTTHPSAKCPDCGYVLGSAWTKRELPPEVINWAETFGTERKPYTPPKVRTTAKGARP